MANPGPCAFEYATARSRNLRSWQFPNRLVITGQGIDGQHKDFAKHWQGVKFNATGQSIVEGGVFRSTSMDVAKTAIKPEHPDSFKSNQHA